MDNGIKVEDIDLRTYYALEETIQAFSSNNKFKMLNHEILETYEHYYQQGLPLYIEEN